MRAQTNAADSLPAKKKTVLEVSPTLHERMKEAAKASDMSVRRFTGISLEYVLQKIDAGEVSITEPKLA